jgi:hypothetical protein
LIGTPHHITLSMWGFGVAAQIKKNELSLVKHDGKKNYSAGYTVISISVQSVHSVRRSLFERIISQLEHHVVFRCAISMINVAVVMNISLTVDSRWSGDEQFACCITHTHTHSFSNRSVYHINQKSDQ